MKMILLVVTINFAVALHVYAQSASPSFDASGNSPLSNANSSNSEANAPTKGDSLKSTDSSPNSQRARGDRSRRDRKTGQDIENPSTSYPSASSVHLATPTAKNSSGINSDTESANSTKNLLENLDYPELNVVPRTSERLQNEAQREASFGWLSFWPFNLSAISTLHAGYAANGSYKDSSVSARDTLDLYSRSAMAVGASWLALTTYYSFTKPYVKDWDRIRKIKGNDRRSDLTRERYAEEALEEPARLIKIFTWASVLTNFAINVMLIDAATPDKNINAVIGAFGSLLPLIFNNRYIENFEKQQEYKRKIYAPVAGFGFQQNIYTTKLEPQLTFNWSF